MFIRNNTNKEIGEISWEGYNVVIPVGVSLADDTLGSFLVGLYKANGEGLGLPPVMEAEQSEWDNKTHLTITRFKVDHSRIPNRNDLLRIARKRGVDESFLNEANGDDSPIENEDIAKKINELPVPKELQYPEAPKEAPKEETETE